MAEKLELITIRVPQSVKKKLIAQAEREKRTISNMTRLILEEYFERNSVRKKK